MNGSLPITSGNTLDQQSASTNTLEKSEVIAKEDTPENPVGGESESGEAVLRNKTFRCNCRVRAGDGQCYSSLPQNTGWGVFGKLARERVDENGFIKYPTMIVEGGPSHQRRELHGANSNSMQ